MEYKSRAIDIIIPVYNGAPSIISNINRLLTLPYHRTWQVGIIVVDDGSTDSTASLIAEIESPRLRLLRLAKTSGRAAARDFGARNSGADYFLFLDCDCTPDFNNYLQDAITILEEGANLIFGPISNCGTSSGFWAYYLTDVEKKRSKHALNGQWINAITSANLLIERDYYYNAGGFNPEYRHYGFEDRDFILRLLAKKPRIVYSQAMRVCHDANNTVSSYCTKMEMAARYSASLFFREHPDQYKKMPYGTLDSAVNNSLWLKIITKMSDTIKQPLIMTAIYLVNKPLLPYSLKKIVVRTAAAISYIHGSKLSTKSDVK